MLSLVSKNPYKSSQGNHRQGTASSFWLVVRYNPNLVLYVVCPHATLAPFSSSLHPYYSPGMTQQQHAALAYTVSTVGIAPNTLIRLA